MAPQQLTPTELCEKYPLLAKIGWDSRVLGTLASAGLLRAAQNRSKRISLIDEHSVKNLVKYRNNLFDQEKIEL